jgi:hypothetical protein
MAVRSIAVTDTLETFRTQFNALAADDFGDIATLDATLSATTIIGAVNELSAQVSASLGIFVQDVSSTVQQIGAGQTLTFLGTSNQINAVVSVPDTLTISLPNDVTIANNLIVSNDLTVTNTTLLDGTLTIATGSITDSTGQISFSNENLITTGTINTGGATVTSLSSTGAISGTTITGTSTITGANLVLTTDGTLTFEGSINDDFETTLTVVNPTADRTITLPNITGTVVTTGDTGTVTSTMILNGTIVNADIADTTIRAAKLNLSADTLVVDTLQANTITGTASVAQLVELTDNGNLDETVFLTFADGATGNQGLETDAGLTYNPSTNILSTTASQANYADLAEKYVSDEEYLPGTIVMFGGLQEITIATEKTKAVAGVISEKPAYLMNSGLTDSLALNVALQGRVQCKVKGNINKGDMIVVSDIPGVGIADNDPKLGTVVGKALQSYNSEEVGTIEVVVGRL